ncbi:hypothetical protein ASPZODRAFT_133980 [Penicilliopsis zonata CBS 506.65]|uniref:Uncharacterized protein n=1 Tax=Penicilliopsis zonata CBS 506.65 TaxID=1073090 RepID=A0A1L9SE60_9EURO|nr:hypothetical protein ASPZODRAFT_133980 [Penicilliopsis zonata CBS 506.65]OJJ45334.1 hypothetical protein ASPZODRAFT_133980 [Penicilliopsis zonata CBS 506.65]
MWTRFHLDIEANHVTRGLFRLAYVNGTSIRARLAEQTRPLQTRSSLRTPSQRQERDEEVHDRRSLKPQRTETAKSGTDDDVASMKTAYDPTTKSPESEFEASERESRQRGEPANPLNVSPANQEVSSARDPMEGGADRNVDKSASTRGRPRKHGKGHVGGEGQTVFASDRGAD